MEWLKRPVQTASATDPAITSSVQNSLADIEQRGITAVQDHARRLDGWDGDFLLSPGQWEALCARVPEQIKADIHFAHNQIARFASAQRASLADFEIETLPGVSLSQRVIPVQCVGCYVPGGRYAHVASALMSVTTAKAAGVPNILVCSPPRGEHIDPAVAYALSIAGADRVFQLGGVQAVAALAYGLLEGPAADMIVGPGNSYVAEAKRLLFGRVGIDVIAGPTESAIIADDSADPFTIAVDLLSQAEHGPTSPVWLLTDSRALADAVLELAPKVMATLPESEVCAAAWRDCGAVAVGEDREAVASLSDQIACEHLQVMARDLPWWQQRLLNYGSLFLGEGSTVTHGDKCAGPNHILPTGRAARYSGGLNVQKFLKVLTCQQISEQANEVMSAVASRLSRYEGMEGHARACDWRLQKYFPERNWDFEVFDNWSAEDAADGGTAK